MGGVGSDTVIEFVEVVANTDDGFEWFGGTVSTRNLFSLYCQDESFDIDEGHQGNHQFLFALQSDFSDYGTEADGGNKTGSGVKTGTPLTLSKIYNATYIGGPNNNAFRLKDNYAGQFHNSIFTEYGGALMRVDDADTAGQIGGNLCFTHSILDNGSNPDTYGARPADEQAILNQLGNEIDLDPELSYISKNGFGEVVQIDPRPVTTGPAWGSNLLEGAPVEVVDYRGAFGNDLWVLTWTYGSNEGIVVPSFSELTTPAATIVGKGGVTITAFSVDAGAGTAEVSFSDDNGVANGEFELTGGADLASFPTLVAPTGATVGSVSGTTITTDGSGNATVQFNLGSDAFFQVRGK